MEQVEISICEDGTLKVAQRWDLGASLWRSLQNGLGHHRVDKPCQYDDDAEFNCWLKFGFTIVCCLAVLNIIICSWFSGPPSSYPLPYSSHSRRSGHDRRDKGRPLNTAEETEAADCPS